ncbi:MAG: hypothetical protein OEW88_08840, partial [Gammaproteobacteria bacterium]|nr:hypothetical protein [Gammaproteobacteria bacterium]
MIRPLFSLCCRSGNPAALMMLALFLSAIGLMPAHAASVNNGCMRDVAGFNLNCTSNDVRVAGVATHP